MKTISVTAHYERKLNTGNYSSVILSTWATVELEEGDTEDEATAHAMNICREAVREAAQPFISRLAPVTISQNGVNGTNGVLHANGEIE